MFDWNDLRYLLAVARGGSTLAAARALGVNQTTVARRLEALEAALGVKLFDRGQTGSRLTGAGGDLIALAEGVERSAAAIAERAGAHARGLAGVVRVTTNEPTANIAIMPVLPEFRRLFPDIKVEMIVTDEHLDLLKGEADVAVRGARAVTNPDLVVRRITDIPWAIYASRGYIAQHGRPTTIADLASHFLVGGEQQVATIGALEWMLLQAPEAEVVCRSNTLSNLYQAVRAGLGVGPLPCIIGAAEPDLVRCVDTPADFTDHLWLVTAPELKTAPRVRAFMDFITPNIIARLKAFQDAAEARAAADG
jgi:DNA-binding transcriptional LysR family regulator